jgi:hypothetical protein
MYLLRLFFILIFTSASACAQDFVPNYDEANVPAYNLPELLRSKDGRPVQNTADWEEFRREEILAMFAEEMYGKLPKATVPWSSEVRTENRDALGDLAVMKQVRLRFGELLDGPYLDLLIFLPKNTAAPVPVFMGLNFAGNQSVHPDAGIHITQSWVANSERWGVSGNKAGETSRGMAQARWPVRDILAAGYGLVTAYYGDLDPDYDDGFQNGIHPLFYRTGQNSPRPDEWGSIGAWAWGLCRALDYLEKDSEIDAGRVVLLGHSRLGKAALWAGAVDPRFAIVISNNSGCGGAALSRRAFGETVGRINRVFPHWFCDNFQNYNENEAALPLDQHMLLALIAPRPLYIASAAEDLWADPKGEFLAGLAANPVYRLYGHEGMPQPAMPELNTPVMGRIGYHIRSGVHDVTPYDWEQFIRFADHHFGKK